MTPYNLPGKRPAPPRRARIAIGATLAAATLLAPTAAAQSGPVFRPVRNAESAGFSAARLARIDSMVENSIAAGEIPGAVVFIARHGRIVMHRAYGVRDASTRAPMRGDDIFRIASQSKAITALAVMMLWEEGRFGLDDPVSRYIPEFVRPRVLTKFTDADSSWTSEPAGREITIRQLLTHTAGLDYAGIGTADFRAIYAKAGVPSGIGNDESTIGDKMRTLAKLPLRAKPGERYAYSLSYDVLGYFVEVVSGMPFDRFLRTRIFDPLGMKDTWFYLPSDRHERLVALHDGEQKPAAPMRGRVFDGVNPDFPTINGTYFSGGAGLSSTVEDYARFLQLFVNGGELDRVRLLSPKTVAMMLSDQLPTMTEQMGLGFGLETSRNDHTTPRAIGAFSWGGAFQTTYWADPAEGLVALLYTNMVNSQSRALLSRFSVLTYSAMVR